MKTSNAAYKAKQERIKRLVNKAIHGLTTRPVTCLTKASTVSHKISRSENGRREQYTYKKLTQGL